MTDDHATSGHEPIDAAGQAHPADEHGAGRDQAPGGVGAHDEHAHDEMALGPVDIAAWGAGILGLALGLVTAFSFALSTGLIAS
ncbi:MAG: hypothetical protein ACOYXS_09920 [Chloroflexota bacterium]